MSEAFCKVAGQWQGTAEVYGGDGRFAGNGVDRRSVVELGDGRTRIDLSFTGPFKFAGHYVIRELGRDRVYEGPVNVGFAEALGPDAVQADSYWASIGMSQRFFLMVLPGGDRQLSLALLSRGERLCYAVVGENHKLDACGEPPSFADGAAIDLAGDPAAGRGEVLLHRPGRWVGALSGARYEERVELIPAGVRVRAAGGAISPEPYELELATDGWVARTGPGAVVGSYSLSGGRASSGQLHKLADQLRVWRREVCSHDGAVKAVVHNWYRGGERVGVQYGALEFHPE